MRVKHRIVGIGNSIVNGETTEGIVKRFNRDLLFHCPDIGILLSGTNDAIYKAATPEQVVENIRWMVERMEEDNIRPVLLTPLLTEPITASQHWMATANIDYREVNVLLKQMARLMEKEFPQYTLDMQNLFKKAIEEKRCENVYLDGLHPTAEGHQIMAEIIVQYLNQILDQSVDK